LYKGWLEATCFCGKYIKKGGEKEWKNTHVRTAEELAQTMHHAVGGQMAGVPVLITQSSAVAVTEKAITWKILVASRVFR
jgi:hypothetical protein